MLAKIKKYARKNRGAVLVEYVIILSFVAALAVAIGLNDDSGLKGAATTAAANAKTDLTTALGGGSTSNSDILAQAGQSMLAQANTANQGVLSLLQ